MIFEKNKILCTVVRVNLHEVQPSCFEEGGAAKKSKLQGFLFGELRLRSNGILLHAGRRLLPALQVLLPEMN